MVGGGLSSVSSGVLTVLSALTERRSPQPALRVSMRMACVCVHCACAGLYIHGHIGPLGAKQHRARNAWHLSRRIGPENRNLNPVPPKYLVSDFYASPTNVIGLHLCDVTSRRAGLADPGEGPATGVAVVLSSDSRCFYTESW